MTKFIGNSKLREELLRLMHKMHKRIRENRMENVKK